MFALQFEAVIWEMFDSVLVLLYLLLHSIILIYSLILFPYYSYYLFSAMLR